MNDEKEVPHGADHQHGWWTNDVWITCDAWGRFWSIESLGHRPKRGRRLVKMKCNLQGCRAFRFAHFDRWGNLIKFGPVHKPKEGQGNGQT